MMEMITSIKNNNLLYIDDKRTNMYKMKYNVLLFVHEKSRLN